MPPDEPQHLSDDGLLQAVATAMATFHSRFHGRPPRSAKALLLEDDLLICVMGDIYSDVEKTLIEVQQRPVVRAARGSFHHAMRDRLISEVEALSGRQVNAFVSDTHVGPDMEIIPFFLDPANTAPDG